MGLAGAVNSAVTGLQAQSTNIAITSDNIANSSTDGYKSVQGVFSTLVTSTEGSTSFSSGGVSIAPKTLVDQQGLIQSTGSATDLAISGKGFFSVEDSAGNLLLTRAGSFTVNNSGKLTNAAGYTLLGWPLDNNGNLPGAKGNTNTTSADSTSSLTAINTNAASGNASPTTNIKIGMNLNASQSTFQGATVTVAPVSSKNSSVAKGDILIPASGMQEGDQFTFTSNSASSTFVYGGFAKTKDLSVNSAYGASSSSTTFSTGTDLSEGDKFTMTTLSSGTVTFKFVQSNPDTNNGQFNSLATLASAISSTTGLTARTDDTNLYISSSKATDGITFSDSIGTLIEGLCLSNVAAATTGVNRFNTISGLSALVDSQAQLYSTINNPTSGATLDIYSSSPLQTLKLTKTSDAATIDLQSDLNGINTPTALIVPIPVDTTVTSTMIPDTTGLLANSQNAATLSLTDGTNTANLIYGGIGSSKEISSSSTIFGATSETGQFSAGGGLANGEVITFSDGTSSVACTFTTTSGTPATGSFNSLDTLATAISRTGLINARVANGQLYVASVALPNAALTATSTTSLTGAQMTTAFGGSFSDAGGQVAKLVTAKTTGLNRFNTMSQLNGYISGTTGFTTTTPAGSNCTIPISTASGTQLTIGGVNNAQLLSELGIASGDVSSGFFTEMGIASTFAANSGTISNPATIAVTYNPGDKTKNMAGGNISPDFSRNIEMYDSLGTGHSFTLSYLKTGKNQWAVEMYAVDPTQISNDTNGDGLLTSGTVTFNGDGSLASVSSSLTNNITIGWTGGSASTTFNFNLGTAGLPSGTSGATVIGLTDGLRQFDTSYNVDFVQQNGVAAGQFSGIVIDANGVVSAKFSNGQIKSIYKLPIVTVADQDALFQKTGNVFAITQASGDANLKQAGLGGAGVVVPDALEGSTADIASELTKTISIQANYNANATIISTIKSMEQELNQRL